MKILIIGSTAHHSLESSSARAFRSLGCDVEQWDNKRPSPLFGNRNWWRLSRPEKKAFDLLASIEYLRFVERCRPDILFHVKAENIHSYATHRALEKTKARLVVWYPDHPFKADMTSMNVLKSIREAALFCIWGKFLVEPIRSAGAKRVEYLPFAFDPELHRSDKIAARPDLASEISFIGTWDIERQSDLTPLAELPLAIWGPGWLENLPSSHPLRPHIRGGGLYGDDLVAALKSTRIAFNHLRLHNGSSHNVRAMEITGIGGGVMLVRRTPELSNELFMEGSDILCFGDNEELLRVARAELDSPHLSAEKSNLKVHASHLHCHRASRILSLLS